VNFLFLYALYEHRGQKRWLVIVDTLTAKEELESHVSLSYPRKRVPEVSFNLLFVEINVLHLRRMDSGSAIVVMLK
jgi:hypothetical protein